MDRLNDHLLAPTMNCSPSQEHDPYQIIEQFNATQAEYSQEKLIHELFEAQVERVPHRRAVECGAQSLTYTQLNEKADRLARLLESRGVGPDQLVAICVERSVEMIVGLLGILKAGGAYVPLDPGYPPERLAYLISDAAPKILLTRAGLRDRFPQSCAELILLDEDVELAKESTRAVKADVLPSRAHQLAYVIYTSGSTGAPKGVMVEHRSLNNLVSWHIRAFGLQVGTRSSGMAGVGFDASTWEIWPPLCSGGTLLLAPGASSEPQDLLTWWQHQSVDVSFLVTPLAELAYATQSTNERTGIVLVGGDRLRRWPEALPENQHLINNYGPTETTVVATSGRLRKEDGALHIGRPIANTRVYVLDEKAKPLSIGMTGELYIGGDGVARGYLNRPDLTRERFMPDPFVDEPNARMYRTGDLARWRTDGTIEYLGRNDRQVKIRGFRIELGEIEAQLLLHPQVRQAVVLAREDAEDEKHLVAYLTLQGDQDLRPEDLRAHLLCVLPRYMVPSAFLILEGLPLTQNGKLDLNALPLPGLAAYVSQPYEPPAGHTEEALDGICRELLRVERIGRHDNLFTLGAHSLLIVHMLDRFRKAGLCVEVGKLYSNPTIAGLAAVLTDVPPEQDAVPANLIPAGCKAITPAMLPLVALDTAQIARIVKSVPHGAENIQDIYPLTPLQEGLMFHYLLDKSSGDAYVLPMLVALASRSELQDLIRALQFVIGRHEALRTAVLSDQLPRPVQVVYRQAPLEVEEIKSEPGADPIEQLRELMQPGRLRLNMNRAPLMRLYVTQGEHAGPCYALLLLHHLTHDHDSIETMLTEVTACLEGRGQTLPQAVPFRNHVAQSLAYARTNDSEAFFRAKLGDVEEPSAPFGLLDVHGDGSRIEHAHRSLEPALSLQIRSQARGLGVSPATLFHAAWALVVAGTSGQDDAVFGTVLLGRLHGTAGAQHVLGMFVNTLPLRLRLEGLTARSLVASTQRELIELLQHEQASLAVARRCSGISGSKPLFTTILNYLHSKVHIETGHPQLAQGIQVLEWQEWTNYPLVLSIHDHGEEFVLSVQTERRIDPNRVLSYMSTALQSLVNALQAGSQTSAVTLSILPAQERHQVLEIFNANSVAYPADALMHRLFEAQVEQAPEAIAVISEGAQLTYAELNARANQLANHLCSKGVQPQDFIPVIMTRSLSMLISQLAILKSGAVYVPIDPKLPLERQAFMLDDCNARLVLAEDPAPADLGSKITTWIDYPHDAEAIRAFGDSNLDLQLSAPCAAYVMYTSGSSGAPKGVVVPHHAVIRLVINTNYAQIVASDCVAHCSNPAFDASTFEIWAALLNGARLLIVPPSVVLEARAFAGELQQHGATVLWLTAGLFAQYVEQLSEVFGKLRYLLVGGDVLDPGAIRKLVHTAPPTHLLNGYGPTECTTFSTTYPIQATDDFTRPIPIGRPVANTRVYILNSRQAPVPIGAPGEIYIAGAGVALKYLNQPGLTAQRFLADPFSTDSQARMYRTGDLGQWRADGAIEFLGRNDEQVKIRGYRIELGEIEAQLLKHPLVKEAAVLSREDEPGEKRIVAYVVGETGGLISLQHEAAAEAGGEIVGQWQTLYEQTYGAGPAGPSFVGWNSSYTGKPIPEAQMQGWLHSTLERIEELRPRRVLEIGCGVGLLLQHLAPRCEKYVGTDFSAAALQQLQQWLGSRPELQHVELLHRAATELEDLPVASFDTIILNSVVQYFPDIEYLITTLQGATRLLSPGGRIFVGDVRHLGLLSTFHSAVQLKKASASVDMKQLRKRISNAMSRDKELVIDPQFFHALPDRIPQLTAARVQLKRGRGPNELTRHRYDVVLHRGHTSDLPADCDTLPWTSLAELETTMRLRRWSVVRVISIPNARVASEVAAAAMIEESAEVLDVNDIRRRLSERTAEAIEPEALWELGARHGYNLDVTWDRGAALDRFEVVLTDPTWVAPCSLVPKAPSARPWNTYANDPSENELRQRLIPELREYLKTRLPEYMIPLAWVSLRQMPLTANGKVDRRALPVPQDRPEEAGDYIEPRTDLERLLSDIWAAVLRIDQVGVQDNFFDLGGHSLLATQVVTRIGSSLSIELPLKHIFDYPTIEQLSSQVDALRHASLLTDIVDGDNGIEELLENVAAMPESAVLALMQKLSKEKRS